MAGRSIAPHEKSMGSYEIYAWGDALSIASLIDRQFGYTSAKKSFSAFSSNEVISFEAKHNTQISDFIQKTESQREPYLRKIAKDVGDDTKILFLTLALVGVLRTKALIELRDRFRFALAPGGGNRVTISSLYDMSSEVPTLFEYSWPDEAFHALNLTNDEDGD